MPDETEPRAGELVMTTAGVLVLAGADHPRTGRILAAPANSGRVWIDLNILGQHLPQMYAPDEVETATLELAQEHDLCVTCLGYGLLVLNERDRPCPDCKGSGSSRYYVEIKHNEDSSVIEGKLIEHEPLCASCGGVPCRFTSGTAEK